MSERIVGRPLIVGKDRVDRVDLFLCQRRRGFQLVFQRLLMRGFRVLQHCDVFRFLLRQLRKRAAGRRYDEQQSQNHAQYAGTPLFRQEQNPFFDRRPSQTQRRCFARRLRQNRAGVGKALALRQLGGDCLITRQLRVALGANRRQPDERIPPVDDHCDCPAE